MPPSSRRCAFHCDLAVPAPRLESALTLKLRHAYGLRLCSLDRRNVRRDMKTLLRATLMLTLVPATVQEPINAGELTPESSLPFTMTQAATFNRPWRIAFLPDGRMLITEKVGPVWLVTQQGDMTPVEKVPAVLYQGQGGMLGVFLSPHYATDHSVYLTYAEPGADTGTSGLALARARLALGSGTASLESLQ